MWYPVPLRCTLTTGVNDGKDARAPTHGMTRPVNGHGDS